MTGMNPINPKDFGFDTFKPEMLVYRFFRKYDDQEEVVLQRLRIKEIRKAQNDNYCLALPITTEHYYGDSYAECDMKGKRTGFVTFSQGATKGDHAVFSRLPFQAFATYLRMNVCRVVNHYDTHRIVDFFREMCKWYDRVLAMEDAMHDKEFESAMLQP